MYRLTRIKNFRLDIIQFDAFLLAKEYWLNLGPMLRRDSIDLGRVFFQTPMERKKRQSINNKIVL